MNANSRLGRRQILKGAGALTAAGAAAALQIPMTAFAAEDSDEDHRGLAGSWLEDITVTDNSLGIPIPPFQTLFTYNLGGSLVGTASIDLAPGTLSGPTHGAWKRTGHISFRWKGLAFSFDDDTNASRTILKGNNGTYFIEESLTLNQAGNGYNGKGTFKIVDKGAVTLSGSYTSVAKRLTV